MKGGACSAGPSYFNTRFAWAPVVTKAMDIHTDPSCCRIKDLNVVIAISLGLDVTMTQGDSAGLSDLDGPSNSLVLGLQPGLMWQFRPWKSALPSMLIEATNLNTDSGCGGDMYTESPAPYHSLGPDNTIATGSSVDH